MKPGRISLLIWIALVGVIVYQVAFKWMPLWEKATTLQGTDVSNLQLEDETGRPVYLSRFRGKPLIINFWASWCIPCRVEIPLLNGIYASLLEGNKQLIGVNQSESQAQIDEFRGNTPIAFPVYRDRGALSQMLNIQVIPAIAVIDGSGKVSSITYGFRPWIQAYLLWWI
ncbi:MAG: TlpA disulfide reductase family protein [bacterium]